MRPGSPAGPVSPTLVILPSSTSRSQGTGPSARQTVPPLMSVATGQVSSARTASRTGATGLGTLSPVNGPSVSFNP